MNNFLLFCFICGLTFSNSIGKTAESTTLGMIDSLSYLLNGKPHPQRYEPVHAVYKPDEKLILTFYDKALIPALIWKTFEDTLETRVGTSYFKSLKFVKCVVLTDSSEIDTCYAIYMEHPTPVRDVENGSYKDVLISGYIYNPLYITQKGLLHRIHKW